MDDEDKDKSILRVVAENPHAVRDRKILHAKREAKRTLALAAAEMLRVIADGGSTFDLRRKMIDALEAEDHFKDLSDQWLSEDEKKEILAQPLRFDWNSKTHYDEWELNREIGFARILQGSLRLAAHKILEERPHFGGKHSERLIEDGAKMIAPPAAPKISKKEQREIEVARREFHKAYSLPAEETPPRRKPWSSRDSQSYRDTKKDKPSEP